MTTGLRMSPEQYAEFVRKRGAMASQPAFVSEVVPVAPVVAPKPSEAANGLSVEDQKVLRAHRATERFQALGRLPKDEMNKTERAYADLLTERVRIGQVLWWKFHPMNVRLGKNAFYEVDFLVMTSDYRLEIHETKGGRVTDKGQLKIRLCAEAMPVFRMLKITKLPPKRGGGWQVEEF